MKHRALLLLVLFTRVLIGLGPVFAECPIADLSGDCAVNIEDFLIVSDWWLDDCDASNNWCGGTDFDRLGKVNMQDMAVMASLWLAGGGSAGNRSSSLVVASSNVQSNADYYCDGFADDVQIQAAINRVFENGGGTVELTSGSFRLATSLVMKSGVSLKGSGVQTSATHFWDGTATITGGTIITGPVVCLTGNAIYSFGVTNLAFKDIDGVLSTGATDQYGFSNFHMRDVVVESTGETAFYFCNSQHVYFENVKILKLGGSRTGVQSIKGLHFVCDNSTGFQPGNSIFTDFYIQRNKSNDAASDIQGFLIENVPGTTGGVCYLTFVKPQFNMWQAKSNRMTVNAEIGVFTATDTLKFKNGDKIRITSSGPALQLTNNIYSDKRAYFVRDVSGNTFKIAAIADGVPIGVDSSHESLKAIWSGTTRYNIQYKSEGAYFVGHRWIGMDLEGYVDNHLNADYVYNCLFQYNGTSAGGHAGYSAYIGPHSISSTVELAAVAGSAYIHPSSRQCRWKAYGDAEAFGGNWECNNLSAFTVRNNYMNATVFNNCESDTLLTLPSVHSGMSGQFIRIVKTGGDGIVTIKGANITPTIAGCVLDWNGGSPYLDLSSCATWDGIDTIKYTNCMAYLNGADDARVNAGWYIISNTDETTASFATQGSVIVNDAGEGVSYVTGARITNSILVDAVRYSEYAEVQKVGDFIELVCDGTAGWICTNKYIAN